MTDFSVNEELFRFTYLPDYARFLLEQKLTEYVTVNIRFSREANLPLLKQLGHLTEEELVAAGTEQVRRMLTALAGNNIAEHIRAGAEGWLKDTHSRLGRDDITAEDISLYFYLRRKTFSYFLDAYTKNVVEQKFIICEVDTYTTQDELASYKIYLKIQQDKAYNQNKDLVFYKQLLLEAQEWAEIGSFSINFKDSSRNIFTPGYRKIFGMDRFTTLERFLPRVHPEDRELMRQKVQTAYQEGGHYEVVYRYRMAGEEKLVWSRGYVVSESGAPVLLRGVVKDITEKEK